MTYAHYQDPTVAQKLEVWEKNQLFLAKLLNLCQLPPLMDEQRTTITDLTNEQSATHH